MHEKKCPMCPAVFMAEALPVVENRLVQHINESHAGKFEPEVPWTLDDLKILEGMKISPK